MGVIINTFISFTSCVNCLLVTQPQFFPSIFLLWRMMGRNLDTRVSASEFLVRLLQYKRHYHEISNVQELKAFFFVFSISRQTLS